jgi:hypothetical protein
MKKSQNITQIINIGGTVNMHTPAPKNRWKRILKFIQQLLRIGNNK